MTGDLIRIGQITAPHGVQGHVRVYPLTDFPERFRTLHTALLGPDHRQVRVTYNGMIKNLVILQIEGIRERNQAEALRREYLLVPKTEVYPLPEGHYYAFDLEGLSVIDPEGNALGRLIKVDKSSPAHDLYVIETLSGRQCLVPAVRQFIKEINLEKGHMVLQPIPGLLED